MDILDAGVVHSTGASGFGVQSALKDGAENGGRDVGPVEILTAPMQNQVNNLIAQAGNFYVLVRKQTAVDIGGTPPNHHPYIRPAEEYPGPALGTG